MTTYNAQKLDKELTAAGIMFSGCNSAGIVWGVDNTEIQARADVVAVLAAHNPEPDYTEKRERAYSLAGVTDHEMTVALWEMMVENRPEAAQALQLKRIDVKNRIPKSIR